MSTIWTSGNIKSQVPFLFGVTAIEKVASLVIHWIFRRTGRHLFLTDNDGGQPPLLQRMVDDCGDLYFLYVSYKFSFLFVSVYIFVQSGFCHFPPIFGRVHFTSVAIIHFCRSALRAFKRRVAYANVGYDRIHPFVFLSCWFSTPNTDDNTRVIFVFFNLNTSRYCGLEDIINPTQLWVTKGKVNIHAFAALFLLLVVSIHSLIHIEYYVTSFNLLSTTQWEDSLSVKYPHIVYEEKSETKKVDQYARDSIGEDDNCNDELEGEIYIYISQQQQHDVLL